MDVTRLTEDEQIALAIQMSMSQAESARYVNSKLSNLNTKKFIVHLKVQMMLK